jgi:hypothetical protein
MWGAFLAASASIVVTGCATPASHPSGRTSQGIVYYLDGAGGGGVVNWASDVRRGLREAGYAGAFETFDWETGLGVIADQEASNAYKRHQARKLAEQMVAHHEAYPQAPVTVIGLSAGTAIAVFALEALPADFTVDNVILLSSSLSANYDLTKALRHVGGKLYVTTSQHDPVLGALVALTGPANRGSHTDATLGVEGPELPADASAQTRRSYAAKIRIIPWRPALDRFGDYGGHTGTVAAPFIAHYVAPLVRTKSGVRLAAASQPAPHGKVKNPDYERWSQFDPGSWVEMDGRETVDGNTRPIHTRVTLVRKEPGRLVLRRESQAVGGQRATPSFPRTVYASATIAPEDDPLTHPNAQVTDLGEKTVRVGQRELTCHVEAFSAPADFRDWGSRPHATVYLCDEVPSGIVRIDLETRVGEHDVAVTSHLADFHAVTK